MRRNPVTILMPVRNGLEFLPSALRGIEACIGSQDEVVIIDDHSTDGGVSIIKAWAAGLENVQVISNPGKGLVDALNFGIKQAKNEWIARFDVDDIYDESRLDSQMAFIGERVVAVFSDYEFIASENEMVGIIRTAVMPDETALSIISSQRLAHSSVIYSKSAVLKAGGYFQADYPAEDLGLWLRLIGIGDLVSCPLPLLHYRISSHSITSQSQVAMSFQKNRLLAQSVSFREISKHLSSEIFTLRSRYKIYEGGRERRILFLRDLLLSYRYGFLAKHRLVRVLVILAVELLNPSAWLIITRLYKEKKRRQKKRFG